MALREGDPVTRFSVEPVADFQQARLFIRYPDQRLKLDERDARVSASYVLARPKTLRVLAGLSH
jgi:hypothetical protein